jgi:hypothetical protein
MRHVFDAVDAYEIAFGYRDIPAEVDLLTVWSRRHGPGRPDRVLELAAGPADHALESEMEAGDLRAERDIPVLRRRL